MADKTKTPQRRPTMPVTEPCAVFFKEIYTLYSFLIFTLRTVEKIDDTAKAAAKEMLRLSGLVDGLVDQEQRAESERVAKEGTGIIDALRSYGRFINEITICRGVDSYLNYLSELLALIFRTRPETMKSGEMVRIDAVLEHKTMEDLIAALAARRVHDLSYQGMASLTTYLDSRLGFNLFTDEGISAEVVRIVETRNLIVHNRGVVNEIFASRMPSLRLQIGEQIKLGAATNDVELLEQAVYDMDARAATKFRLPRPAAKIEFDDKMLGKVSIS
jgi:hypothetical protein